MAFSELFVCSNCGVDRVLIHAEEWAPPTVVGGASLPYPGRGPIGGLRNQVWCPNCRAVRAFDFLTLDPPGEHAVVAYAEAQRRGCDGRETGPCPACKTPLTWQLEGEPCPDCNIGKFSFTGEWEDAV